MKLQIKRGLPGSGKTTEAYSTVRESGNVGRVNRDDLRAMLFESVWTGKREQVVIDCEKAIAKVLFEHSMGAIIDDTNLSPGHVEMWKSQAKQIGFSEVTVDPIKADLPVAVEQDLHREKYIGKAIIHRMALFNGLIDFGDKPIVIVDLDGTLADGTEREKHLEGERKDWKTYFSLCHTDKPIEFVIKMVRALVEDYTICIVSGRPDTTQGSTLAWLNYHNVPYDYIFMRSGSDRRPDIDVKKQILDKMPKAQIKLVLDDRPVVVRMWQENGLRVIPVRGAIDEF